MKHIKVSHKTFGEHVVSYDDADAPVIELFTWTLHRVNRTMYCVHRRMENGITTRFYMHRLIMEDPKGMLVDHKDGNGLNNTRNNLRICTQLENTRNCRLSRRNTTGFKGVTRYNDKFRASIVIKGSRKHIGVFDDAKSAAAAYNSHALVCFGQFANPNIIE